MNFEKINTSSTEVKGKEITGNSMEGVSSKLSPENSEKLEGIQNKIDKLQDKIEQNPNEVVAEKDNFISELKDVEKSYDAIKEKLSQGENPLSIESIPQLKEISTQLKEVKDKLNQLETEQIEKPIFLPVVGDKYNEGINGKKVVILADSHYLGKKDMEIYDKDKTDVRISGITKNVVEQYTNYIDGNGEHHSWMNTYTKGYKVLGNQDMSKSEIKDIIDKTAFYNYVQTPMSGPREAPSLIDYKNAEQPFRNVLKELQPDVVVVWGNRSWDSLPEDLKNNKNISFVQITHPSASSFNYQKEYEKIKSVL